MPTESQILRRAFFRALFGGIRVVWPILSGLLVGIVTLGVITGILEGWSLYDSLYFSMITGLTIGYGDFAPSTNAGRVLAVVIGFGGLLLTALLAAVAVKALSAVASSGPE